VHCSDPDLWQGRQMTERIRELAEQNGFIHKWMPPGEQYDKLQSLEKFAELIVKECGVALSPMLRDMVSRGHAFDLIKQHFGVEGS
jgi:hypothetical protein